MDRDQSSSITRAELDCEEFRSVIRSVLAPAIGGCLGGVTYARAEMNMNQAIDFCLRKADLNRNNSLSFEEFEAFMLCLRQHPEKDTASLIFALFDLDGDQMIDEREFREIYRFFLGHSPIEADLQEEWFNLVGTADQKVSRDRYIRWLRTSTNPVFRQHAPKESVQAEAVDMGAMSETGGSSQATGLPVNHSLPRMRSSASLHDRPMWNQRFAAGADNSSRAPQAKRSYFSRAQSLPELLRHYESHRGFHANREKLNQQEPRRKPPVLSTDTGAEMLPTRAVPGGYMRNAVTGRRQLWEDHWQAPLCMRSKYQPGTLDLRCPGPPPRWLYADDEA